MIITLYFTCQAQSSKVIMDSQMEIVIFESIPSNSLSEEEKSSCMLQSNFTSVYQVTIGNNIFISEFVIYNPFKAIQINLYPIIGSSVAEAIKYSIASYEITFLENALIQQSSVGDLLQNYYNYNQCITNTFIEYEAYSSIKPVVQTNPNCIIIPTAAVEYSIVLNGKPISKNQILLVDYNFAELNLESIECSIGTEEDKKKCQETTIIIAEDNFININLLMIIPKTIITINNYIDDYNINPQPVLADFQFFFALYMYLLTYISNTHIGAL